MKQLFITFFLIILPVTGCAESFEEQFESVAVGASRVSVEQKLGEARKTTSGRVPSDPFWGPQEGLEAVLGAETEYEEWQYRSNNRIYLVWFGNKNDSRKQKWRVVGKTSYPEGAVF